MLGNKIVDPYLNIYHQPLNSNLYPLEHNSLFIIPVFINNPCNPGFSKTNTGFVQLCPAIPLPTSWTQVSRRLFCIWLSLDLGACGGLALSKGQIPAQPLTPRPQEDRRRKQDEKNLVHQNEYREIAYQLPSLAKQI